MPIAAAIFIVWTPYSRESSPSLIDTLVTQGPGCSSPPRISVETSPLHQLTLVIYRHGEVVGVTA